MLVISAVEGVQVQTRLLMRTLQRLRIPTLLFVNKIDRLGARYDDLLADVGRLLTPASAPMGSVLDLGHRSARFEPFDLQNKALGELLAERNDELPGPLPGRRRCRRMTTPTSCGDRSAAAQVHPVLLRLRDDRRRACRADRRHPVVVAARNRIRCGAPCRQGFSRSSAARPGRRSRRRGCSPARCQRVRTSTCTRRKVRRTRRVRRAVELFERGSPPYRRPGRGRADRRAARAEGHPDRRSARRTRRAVSDGCSRRRRSRRASVRATG